MLGADVSSSLSPRLHNAAYRALGLDWEYGALSLPSGDLKAELWRLYRQGALGCNLTAPFKEQAFRLLSEAPLNDVGSSQLNDVGSTPMDDVGSNPMDDAGSVRWNDVGSSTRNSANVITRNATSATAFSFELDDAARRLGSVNTIAMLERCWRGFSTDGPGWVRAFTERFGATLSGRPVVMLGAGGAARALAAALEEAGAREIAIVNRTPERALLLISDLGLSRTRCLGSRWEGALQSGTLVIQATTCRSAELDAIWRWPADLPDGVIACDILYGSKPSAFLAEARRRSLPSQDGLGMLLHQAALALELWSGRPAPIEAMRQSVREFIKS